MNASDKKPPQWPSLPGKEFSDQVSDPALIFLLGE